MLEIQTVYFQLKKMKRFQEMKDVPQQEKNLSNVADLYKIKIPKKSNKKIVAPKINVKILS